MPSAQTSSVPSSHVPILAALAMALLLLYSPGAYAVTCNGVNKPPVPMCQSDWRCAPADGWIEVYSPAGTSCNSGNSCVPVATCNGSGICDGPNTCPPNTPGPTSGPGTSAIGIYTIYWGASGGGVPVTQYEIVENNATIMAVSGASLSATITQSRNGTYTYVVRACNGTPCSPYNASAGVSVVIPPSAPGVISGPSTSSTGSYTLSWGAASGDASQYQLLENGTQILSANVLTTTLSGGTRASGSYAYQVRACGSGGCGPLTSTFTVAVTACRGVSKPTTLSTCQTGWNCNSADGWLEVWSPTGAVCDDQNACTSNDMCDSLHNCAGTVSCAPNPPGPTSAPASSATGAYSASWTAPTGSVPVSRYEVTENSAALATVGSSTLSTSVTGRIAGAYSYSVKACNSFACSPANAAAGVNVTAPSAPGPIAGPSSSNIGTYTLTWTAAQGTISSYTVYENGAAFLPSTTALSIDIANRTVGSYRYKVQACGPSICGPFTADFVVSVTATVPTCKGSVKPPLATCQSGWTCIPAEGWRETWAPAGTACDDGNACTSKDICDASHVCAGSVSCVPSTPGATSGPARSTTGAYSLSWTANGTVPVTSYQLLENNALAATVAAPTLTAAVSGRPDGTYSYTVQACNSVGCSPSNAATTVTVLLIPGGPSAMTVPSETGQNYQVTWTAGTGTIASYNLGESTDQVNWTTTSVAGTSQSFSAKPYGVYYYRVAACNASGCSAYTNGAGSGGVNVITSLSTFPDAPVPSLIVPPQGWVGALPGGPSVDGGSAAYHIPIEIPPGRVGMQPEVSLNYSSRGGNGVVGVGWSLSAGGSIYRCPRTLSQDGGNRPVQHDGSDRLCLDGQRLVTGGTYGSASTQYSTEIDSFKRITQQGTLDVYSSSFKVEEKSGRTAFYRARASAPSQSPDAWYLSTISDRQGNCIQYNYAELGAVGATDYVLSSINYTGTGSPQGGDCALDATTRGVFFDYTLDRPDVRTTYLFGTATAQKARLSAIRTAAGGIAARRYELAYHQSGATGRSLLAAAKLCGGATCGNDQFPATTFQYQERAAQFNPRERAPVPPGQTWGSSWRTMPGADFDGDGTRDSLFVQLNPTPVTWTTLSSCRDPVNLTSQSFFAGSAGDPGATSLSGNTDVDGDGRVDVLGIKNGFMSFASLYCSGGAVTPQTSQTDIFYNTTTPAFIPDFIDYDGDGILDLRYIEPGATTQTILRHRIKDPLHWANNYDLIPDPTTAIGPNPNGPALTASLTRDMNGDGTLDTVFEAPNSTGDTYKGTQIAFFQAATRAFVVKSVAGNLGGPPGFFAEHPGRRWMDVNGDGLPDIIEPGPLANGVPTQLDVWINMGGNASPMFRHTTVSLNGNTFLANRFPYSMTMDVDADGQDELLVPTNRTDPYCGGNKPQPTPTADPINYCGDEFDISPGSAYRNLDHSVFSFTAYKLRERSDGSYDLVATGIRLGAPIQQEVNQDDIDGRGTTGLLFALRREVTSAYQLPLADADMGPYLTRQVADAPDLLLKATNGLNAVAAWQHQPLSQGAAADGNAQHLPPEAAVAVTGCDIPAGESFYSVNHLPKPSPGYVFFASSMWVVSRFDASNGVGAGTNRTCYRYKNAMLNNEGRGFQGFQTIISEEQLPPAAGEDTALAPSGCGGLCSVNNVRTTTNFYQEFPLTSRVQDVTVQTAATGALLAQKSYWYHEASGTAPGSFVVFGTATQELTFDKNGQTPPSQTLAVETTSIDEVDPVSGEAQRSCVTVQNPTPNVPAGTNASLKLVTRSLVNDTSAWWLGRMNALADATDFVAMQPLAAACRITGVTGCGSPPTCPNATSTAKTRTTNYVWMDDGVPAGSRRKLSSEMLAIQNATESSAAYQYDTAGNIVTKSVSARDVSTEAAFPPSTRGSVSLPGTTYGYSSDRYFKISEVDTLNHPASTQVVDAATGQVTHSQPFNAPAVDLYYDSVGRLYRTDPAGGRAIWSIVTDCAGTANCALKRQVYEAGAPIKTEYLDLLGRAIGAGVEGFDGYENVARVDFNQRGAKLKEYAPYHSSFLPGGWDGAAASPYGTSYSNFDARGRIGVKTGSRNAGNLFEAGSGDASLVTTYQYSVVSIGLRTDIAVTKAASQGGPLTMSRTYDRRGQLVQTTQHVSAGTARDIPVTYYYDSAGNVTSIVDANGNPLNAEYDDLGRKTKVDDPDRGVWYFAWDGLSRLRTQTDARGVTIAHEYDAIGRLERRFMKRAGDPAFLLEANWLYDQNNMPGTLSSLRGVTDTEGGSLTNAGVDYYHRDYSYDSLWRPWSVQTHVPANGTLAAKDFAVEYGYDQNYGRMKAVKYPSGEIAGLNYDSPRGNLLGEWPLTPAGAAAGAAYRTVNSLSERGQITMQTFGNGIIETDQYDDSTGMPLSMNAFGLSDAPPSGCSATHAAYLVHEADYKYDQFLNVSSQKKQFLQRDPVTGALLFSGCTPQGATATEAYSYDELQRLRSGSRSWTGLTVTPASDSYTYDDLGNILSKSDYGDTYLYGSVARAAANLAGPHAVTSVSLAGVTKPAFTYDLNGNMLSGDGRAVTFDNFDRPITITMAGITTQFLYAPDGSRYLQRTSGGSTQSNQPKVVYYVDKVYELIAWSAAATATEEKTYIGPSVAIYRGASREVRYVHTDHLGSVNAVTRQDGSEFVGDAHGFDAFGKPRGRDWQPSGDKLHPDTDYGKTTEHGFTGHEHLDDTFLIHMNGRVYDYRLGRFLSVDPVISNPLNSQSINPYSYIGNNPLSGIDPSGYQEAPPPSGPGYFGSEGYEASGNIETQQGDSDGSARENGFEPASSKVQSGLVSDTASAGKIGGLDSLSNMSPVGTIAAAGATITCAAGPCELVAAAAVVLAGIVMVGINIASHQHDSMSSDKLSPEAEKGIRKTEKVIEQHEEKLKNLRENPTVRPGLEDAPKEVQQKSIDGRINHLEKEIKGLHKSVEKLKKGEVKPTTKDKDAQITRKQAGKPEEEPQSN